jgi:hypothetical protein
MLRRWSEFWLELVDAGVAAPEGGLRVRLSGERRGGGGGSSLRSCGWRGADVGGLGVGGASASTTPRSCIGGLTRGQRRAGGRRGAARRIFRAKAQCFGTNGCGACGYRYPLGGAGAATFSAIELRVKTLDHWSRRRRRGTSLPSWGRRRGAPVLPGLVVFGGKF